MDAGKNSAGKVLLGCLALTAFGVFLLACIQADQPDSKDDPLVLDHNVCLAPHVREVRVSPLLDEDWQDAVSWAFGRWREAVPGLLYRIVVTDAAAPVTLPCVTSFVAFSDEMLRDPDLYGITRNGYVLLAPKAALSPTGKRSVTLHELGHLLFGFGESKVASSIMHLPLNPPVLSQEDVIAARGAFLRRDGVASAS